MATRLTRRAKLPQIPPINNTMKNITLTLVTITTLSVSANAQTLYSNLDTAMVLANYTNVNSTSGALAGSTTQSTSFIASGGNTGSYLKINQGWVAASGGGSSVGNYYDRTGWTYDPSLAGLSAGTVLKFTASIDTVNDPGNQGTGVYARQGGVTRLAFYDSASQLSWDTISGTDHQTGLTSDGGVIQFGIFTANSTRNVSGVDVRVSQTAGYDNLNVAISVVPEPSSTALLGLGSLGLLARRKR